MILIADSGSTKCDWVLIKEDKSRENYLTMGFNPFFHSSELIVNEIKKELLPKLQGSILDPQHRRAQKPTGLLMSIFFYGAGCSSEKRNLIVKNALKTVFPAAEILVDHDLRASAYSVYEGEPCIACILGTGSNSCFFDGKNIYEEVPALGYILGDEGSGSYYGKILLRKFLYHQLPDSINSTLQNEYKLTKEIIFDKVYRQPDPNVYLASFFKVLVKHKEEKVTREIIRNGFLDFMKNHICCYKNFKKVKANFVGSVSFCFEDILGEAAAEMKISIGKVIKQPINDLGDYHLKYIAPIPARPAGGNPSRSGKTATYGKAKAKH